MNRESPSPPASSRPDPVVPVLTRAAGFACAALLFSASALRAQGILTVTPTRSAATLAGAGAVGYTGDGAAAVSATLANPSAVAYDASGNLYLADENNHVIREVSTGGIIATVAGDGTEGYSGDGAAATSAQLDTPTGVAVDKSGNLYIADSHNQRIRMVSGGVITTLAGTGANGYAGDGGAAASATLALPSGVAVDSSGNVYIADTDNHRIRMISAGTITTIAGDGEELYAGDGGAATAAALDSPTGVAVDASGNVYIADRLNQRIREVSGGTIVTVAGSGAASFSGGFNGDGISPTAATLAKPTGISIDSAGNLYVADTNNQVVRQIGGDAIVSIAGSPSTQGFGGDNGPANAALLNAPKAVAAGASGNLSIADTLNQRIRSATLPTLSFPNTAVGIDSSIQSLTLANTGSASLSVSGINFTGAFTTVTGGSCPPTPISLAAGASCIQNIAFLPTATGADSGSVVFSGSGVVPQTVLLAGTGTQASSSAVLTTTEPVLLAGQAVTLTAAISPQGVGTPTGTVSFLDSGTLVGTPVTLAAGATTALLVTTSLPGGANAMTAVYSGDADFAGATSNAVSELVEDFSLNAAAGAGSLTVEPGKAALFSFNVAPLNGAFSFPIVLSATGLPPGATATFTPTSLTPGSTATTFSMSIQTPAQASLLREQLWRGGGAAVFALLLLPFGRRMRRGGRSFRPLLLALFAILATAATAGLTGCGSSSGFFGQPQQTYTITVTGTATSGRASLQHSATVTLTVE